MTHQLKEPDYIIILALLIAIIPFPPFLDNRDTYQHIITSMDVHWCIQTCVCTLEGVPTADK